MTNTDTMLQTKRLTGPASVSLMLFCFIFPFSVKLSLLFLVLHFIFSLKENIRCFRPRIGRANLAIPVSILLYVIYAISLIWTHNVSHGIKDVETKLTLLILPLLVYFFPRTDQQRLLFITAFTLSVAFASIICGVQSLYMVFSTGDLSYLFYDKFSFLMHPTYFTMYCTMALGFWLLVVKDNNNQLLPMHKYKYFLLVLFVGSVMLASSRAGIIIGLGSLLIYLYTAYFRKGISIGSEVRVMVVSLVIFTIILVTGSGRFQVLINELAGSDGDKQHETNTRVDVTPVAHRVALAGVAWEVLNKHPFGVGAGDVQDVLVAEYRRIGYEKAALVRYNPHNQYLQTGVATGYAGLLVLVILMIVFLDGAKRGSPGKLLFLLGCVAGGNALFESVLEVQRGVLFVTVLMIFLVGENFNSNMNEQSKG